MEKILQNIYEYIISGNRNEVEQQIQQALSANIPPEKILNECMIAAMEEVGARFERSEFYVPEMLIAARSMKAGLAILKPYLVNSGVEMKGKVVIGTVQGDLHDIGKNLVAMMLEGAGYEVIDLGTDVPPEEFIKGVREHGAHFLGLSALLTTTMQNMRSTIMALEENALRESVKVVIGGAPVTDAFAAEIGADGYAPDAGQAVSVVKALA